MTTTETAPRSYSTGLIEAKDFDGYADFVRMDDGRGHRTYRWTDETMGYVIEALAGRRVIICTDAYTGHTQNDVELRATRPTPGYGGWQVLIRQDPWPIVRIHAEGWYR